MENKFLLPSKRFATASEQDLYLEVDLQQSSTLSPLDVFQKTTSNYQIYLQERSDSNNYRVNGNCFLIASNVLCEMDGEFGFEGVENARNYDPITGKPEFTVDEVLFKNDGWYYYINNNNFCQSTELEPKRERFQLTNVSAWYMFVTYPFAKNLKPLLFNGIDIKDGIAFMEGGSAELDGKELSYFICPLEHNLSIGDNINIYNEDGFVKKATVYQNGLLDNTYKKSVFFIDEKIDFIPTLTSKKYRFKKVIGDYESEYYSRWYKKLTQIGGYDVFRTAFSKNLFSDSNYSFVYPDTIDLTDVVDHLNRPLTELYISVIKSRNDPFWGNTLSAINTTYSNINYDFNMVYEGGTLSPVEVLTPPQDSFFGNIVEYNIKTLIETELNYAVHIFNSTNRLENTLFESYYYKPHYKADIKLLSEDITKEDGFVDVPNYAVELDGIKHWRDINENDAVPYLNKHHYIYYNFSTFIRRQDVCKRYMVGSNALISEPCPNFEPTKVINIEKEC
jgi:hypothetical protein